MTSSFLRHSLENAIPHVLIILNCCFVANAARDAADGTTKEILTACDRHCTCFGNSSGPSSNALCCANSFLHQNMPVNRAKFVIATLILNLSVAARLRHPYTTFAILTSMFTSLSPPEMSSLSLSRDSGCADSRPQFKGRTTQDAEGRHVNGGRLALGAAYFRNAKLDTAVACPYGIFRWPQWRWSCLCQCQLRWRDLRCPSPNGPGYEDVVRMKGSISVLELIGTKFPTSLTGE